MQVYWRLFRQLGAQKLASGHLPQVVGLSPSAAAAAAGVATVAGAVVDVAVVPEVAEADRLAFAAVEGRIGQDLEGSLDPGASIPAANYTACLESLAPQEVHPEVPPEVNWEARIVGHMDYSILGMVAVEGIQEVPAAVAEAAEVGLVDRGEAPAVGEDQVVIDSAQISNRC